jgi:hypothetical protein
MASRPKEKRRTPRIQPYVKPCRVAAGARRFAAYITDLSPRGGRVHCEAAPPDVGAAVVLEMRIGRRVAHSSLPAAVIWSRPGARGGHDFGFAFGGLNAEDATALDAVVEEFQRRASLLA